MGRQLNIMDTPTSVDCGRDVRFRRSFRTLMECMVPACCAFQQSGSLSNDNDNDDDYNNNNNNSYNTVIGTFFGYRKGRINFCLQQDTKSTPMLLLEFAVVTSYLAREMQHGLLRIALECNEQPRDRYCSLYKVPVWSMYCNGRKVGFAVRRQMSENDAKVLKLMQSISVGAGVLPKSTGEELDVGDDLMYLRASFDRVIGSPDSESFHMINPVGSSGQELSVFLVRS